MDFKSGLRGWRQELTVLCLSLMSGLHVRRLFTVRPRFQYDVEIVWLFNVTGGELKFLSDNVTWGI